MTCLRMQMGRVSHAIATHRPKEIFPIDTTRNHIYQLHNFETKQTKTSLNSNSTQMQDLPENHLQVSGAPWVNIVIF